MAAGSIDESLLDLFRSEAETQTASLAQALANLASDPGAPKKITAALNAVRSLKGAARLVGLDKVAQISSAMEAALVAAQDQKRAVDNIQLEALRRGCDWLAQFSQAPLADLANPPPARLAEHGACLTALQGSPELKSAPPPSKTEAKAAASPVLEPEKPAAKPAPPASAAPAATAPSGTALKLDFSLLDLYRTEAETQLSTLVQGLVDLEGDSGDAKKVEPIMRAAHSLKGAARIIGLEPVVKLAHAMEDAFVAAQQGKLALEPASMDAFLRAADWIAQFSRLPQDQLANPPSAQMEAQAVSLADVQAVLAGKPLAVKPAKTPESSPSELPKAAEPSAKPAESAKPSGRHTRPHVAKSEARGPKPEAAPASAAPTPADSVVRVSAASLTRLMGLAAETLVETRRLQPFRDALLKLKNNQLQFVSQLENAANRRYDDGGPPPAQTMESLRSTAQATLEALRAQLENFDAVARRNTLLSGRLYQEVIASRMRPFVDGTHGLARLVRDISRTLGKQARLEIEGRDVPVDRDILERLEAPLNHLLRNACDHGIETPAERKAAGKPEAGTIRLQARHRAGMLVVIVSDDGHGISLERLRDKVVEKGQASAEMVQSMSDEEVLQFLFLPGFSTAEKVTEISGRGVGLDVVMTLMQEIGGTVRVQTIEGAGTTFIMQLPITRSVLRALLVDVDGEAYAFPLSRLNRTVRIAPETVKTIENRPYLALDDVNVGLVQARSALGLAGEGKPVGMELAVVVIGDGKNLYGLEVDHIMGEADLVVRPLDARLGKVPGISSAALSEDGAPILIVDVDDLLAGLEKLLAGGQIARGRRARSQQQVARKRILVVDDSLTVRETERQILENAGYEVEVAVDGADGWNAVRLGKFDLVVSDVDMPRLNGFEFVQRIRSDARMQRLPVIIVSYKDRPEDRARGLEAGADAYLTKSSFQDDTFLRSVTDLIGSPESSST